MEESEKTKKVILVIDDDPMLLTLYKELFKNKGIAVRFAHDGSQGLDLIRYEKPDFVLLDIRMPKIDGMDVLKIMRKDQGMKDVPVGILTNYDYEEYREKTKGLDIVDFWVKTNVDPSALVKKVIEYISGKNKS